MDRACIAEQMGAFDAGAVEMLHLFVEMCAPLVETINVQYEAGDMHALAETAHSLKGAALSACCNALGTLARRLQDEAEKGGPDPELPELITAEFERVKADIAGMNSEKP
ncbi:MAG: Hpt domain-containing protein [Alphaproteobacteria bacterium]